MLLYVTAEAPVIDVSIAIIFHLEFPLNIIIPADSMGIYILGEEL